MEATWLSVPHTAQRRFAPMVTFLTTPTHARLMATTGLAGSLAASSSVPGPGTAVAITADIVTATTTGATMATAADTTGDQCLDLTTMAQAIGRSADDPGTDRLVAGILHNAAQ